MVNRQEDSKILQYRPLVYTLGMSMTSIYPILGLDREASKVKSKVKTKPKDEIQNLLEQYKTLLEVAEKVSSTLLIKHNKWIVQVKSIRQHYLFETEEALTEEQSMGNCAIEISMRDGNKGTQKSRRPFMRSGVLKILSH